MEMGMFVLPVGGCLMHDHHVWKKPRIVAEITSFRMRARILLLFVELQQGAAMVPGIDVYLRGNGP